MSKTPPDGTRRNKPPRPSDWHTLARSELHTGVGDGIKLSYQMNDVRTNNFDKMARVLNLL